MSQNVEVIVAGGSFAHVDFDYRPETGFSLEALSYVPNNPKKDAALMVLEPGSRSPIFYLVDPYSTYRDRPIQGNGTILVQRPNSKVVSYGVDITEDENGLALAKSVIYRPNTIFAYKAGPRGLAILCTESPPFFIGQDEELEIDNPRINPKFIQLLLGIKD